MSSRSVAVLGGGISGLSTAYYLLTGAAKQAGATLSKVYVLESQPRFGGWLRSVPATKSNDFFDLGPRTLSVNSYASTNTIALVGDIGLADRIKYVNKDSVNFGKRYVLIEGKLFQLPSRLTDLFVLRKPFKRFVSYIVKDFRTPPMPIQPDDDVSVESFFNYRFGPEIADYIINPLCIGITGGDSKALSMKSIFPKLFLKEQTHGSIVKSMIFPEDNLLNLASHSLVKRAMAERWAVFSFNEGIQTLPDTLRAYLQDNFGDAIEFLPNNEVLQVQFGATNKVHLRVHDKMADVQKNFDVDQVFSALPAFRLASILDARHAELKSALQSIPTVTMATVSLLYDQNVLPAQVEGFGFLVPDKANSPLLGVTFDSCVFPSGFPGTKMTAMLGGYRFTKLFGEPDLVDPNKLLNAALTSIRSYLKIQCDPVQHLVTVHKDCIPQYNLGHQQRLATIEREISNLNLSLVGASYHGYSVPDCILNAKIQAQKWLEQ